ncbi:MAG TPA: TetR/AcrR family transcriptional regulator [Terriglobales bacterium]|nr:TetR/AcrR family transcriptional regulator [Terriglobales bacterium]
MAAESQEQKILDVAKDLFTRRGFSNVAIRDICRAADVTPPTVYYYFKNKEALFDAVVRKGVSMKEFITKLGDECEKMQGPKEKLRAFTRTYLAYFPQDRLNVGFYVRDSTKLDAIGRDSLMTELNSILTLLTGIVRKGVTEMVFRDTDPGMAAECLLGMMNRFVFQQIHFKRNYKPAEAAAYLDDFFLRAMKPT